MVFQRTLTVETDGRGMMPLSKEIGAIISAQSLEKGLCQIFCCHTSASLTLCENADLDVQQDCETFMARLVPDGDPLFTHTAEGPDDMSAHIRTMLTRTSLTIPFQHKSLCLGTWQGIYLWEHRVRAYRRRLIITLLGE